MPKMDKPLKSVEEDPTAALPTTSKVIKIAIIVVATWLAPKSLAAKACKASIIFEPKGLLALCIA
jgi:hypothetical protein